MTGEMCPHHVTHFAKVNKASLFFDVHATNLRLVHLCWYLNLPPLKCSSVYRLKVAGYIIISDEATDMNSARMLFR